MTKIYSKVICDPHEWLSDVSFRSEGGDILLDIEYDKNIGDKLFVAKRIMTFKGAPYFVKAPFPGYAIVSPGRLTSNYKLGVLNEFINSEWAKYSISVYKNISGGYAPNLRHFSICFTNDNKVFDILATDVIISDEIIIKEV
jgi:hypothetical protein